MAGRRRTRESREALVVRHQRRKESLTRQLTAAACPADRVAVAANYLRGALARLGASKAANDLAKEDADAVARDAQEYLVALGDQVWQAAITRRRSRV